MQEILDWMARHPWETAFLVLSLSVGAWWTFLYFRFAYGLVGRLHRIEAQLADIHRLVQGPSVDKAHTSAPGALDVHETIEQLRQQIPQAPVTARVQSPSESAHFYMRQQAGLKGHSSELNARGVSKSWAQRQVASARPLNWDAPPQQPFGEPASSAILSSLRSFIVAWQDHSLSEQQKRHFEQLYQGVQVSWRVRIHEVNKAPDGRWMVTVRSAMSEDESLQAVGFFDPCYAHALSLLKAGQMVQINGRVDQFFVVPMLAECIIEGFAESTPPR
jgi:hypothetical protein